MAFSRHFHNIGFSCHRITYFVVLIMLRISSAYVLLENVLFKILQKLQKSTFAESILHKVRLSVLIKKWLQHSFFPVNFLEIVKDTFCVKHLRAIASESWRLEKPHDFWSRISFFNPLSFFIFNDSILMDFIS